MQVDLSGTHLGEVISSAQMTALPLNGRSYTDLMAIQPGVAPTSTLLPSSVIMAGVTGSIDPSGDGNPGNLSINGQRESSNGFMMNGIDVQEHMNGLTDARICINSQRSLIVTNRLRIGGARGLVRTCIGRWDVLEQMRVWRRPSSLRDTETGKDTLIS